MKPHLSIKLRVTLWYTALMTLLVLSVLFFLFYTGERLALTGSQHQMIQLVESVDFEWEHGTLEPDDDDFDAVASGIYLSAYDTAGTVLYGTLPKNLPPCPFSHRELQKISAGTDLWYVYDFLSSAEHGEPVWVRGVMSARETDQSFSTLFRLAAISLPTLVLLVALGGYLITGYAFRPVERIRRAAERIGSGHDLSERIALGTGKDELYTLANTFDQMFEQLEDAFERERQFTSDASHELRTPITVILSQCEYALAQSKSIEELQNALRVVQEQAQTMSALVSQLLLLSRADAGHLTLQPEWIDLSELLSLIAEQQADFAAQKQISVQTMLEPQVKYYGDETMLMRLCINLVENGIRYGRFGGTLSLQLFKKAEYIHLQVQDDGIGIAPEHLKRIWERFYQVDSARSSTNSGTGLGLAMVKWIAEAHGGTVSVQSKGGLGSTFCVLLPYPPRE